MSKAPLAVGVPLNTPPDDRLNPGGRALDVVNVTGGVPPLCVKVSLNGTPCVPVVFTGLVTVIIVTVSDACADVTGPQKLLTLTV